MLRNNLKGIVEREVLEDLLKNIGSFPEARGEALSLQQWVTLSNQLGNQLGDQLGAIAAPASGDQPNQPNPPPLAQTQPSETNPTQLQ